MDLISVKFLVVGVVALIVLGPDKLPEAMRRAGRMLAELRRVSAGLREEAHGALGHSELAEPIRELRASANTLRTMAAGWMAPAVFQSATASSGAMSSEASSGAVSSGATPASPEPAVPPGTAPAPEAAPEPAGDPSLN